MKVSFNRRKHKRLRIAQMSKVAVHIFPVMPFIGESIDARLVNLSAGGMALIVPGDISPKKLQRGRKIKIHFRLPGCPISQCRATVSHSYKTGPKNRFIGLRFMKVPPALLKKIVLMTEDNDRCDERVRNAHSPRCDAQCAFFGLCKKPMRLPEDDLLSDQFEIAIQRFEAA